jgi:hypothetical protein
MIRYSYQPGDSTVRHVLRSRIVLAAARGGTCQYEVISSPFLEHEFTHNSYSSLLLFFWGQIHQPKKNMKAQLFSGLNWQEKYNTVNSRVFQ